MSSTEGDVAFCRDGSRRSEKSDNRRSGLSSLGSRCEGDAPSPRSVLPLSPLASLMGGLRPPAPRGLRAQVSSCPSVFLICRRHFYYL